MRLHRITAATAALVLCLVVPAASHGADRDWEYGRQKFNEGAAGVIAGGVTAGIGALLWGTGVALYVDPSSNRGYGYGANPASYPMIGIGVGSALFISPLIANIGGWRARSGVKLMGGRTSAAWGIVGLLGSGVPGLNWASALAFFGGSHRNYLSLVSRGPDRYIDEYDELDELDDGDWYDLRSRQRPPPPLLLPTIGPRNTGVILVGQW